MTKPSPLRRLFIPAAVLALTFAAASSVCLAADLTHRVQPAAYETINGYARQKTQIHGGVYDDRTHKTLIVYSGGISGGLSACSPYIAAYDHGTGTWSAPVQVAPSPVEPDGHNYPQIVIDRTGRYHVFHTMHANHAILHSAANAPGVINGWTTTAMDGTAGATYGAAFTSQNGNMYLFYRSRERSPNQYDYEPEYSLKSVDNGQTWEKTKRIDPYPNDDGWGTVYTKSVHYEPNPEGLHIVFAIHKNHNDFLDAHYYLFFSFADDQFRTVDGRTLGPVVDRQAYTANAGLFSYGREMKFFNTRTAVALIDGGPAVFYNYKVNSAEWLYARVWNQQQWTEYSFPKLGKSIAPYEARVMADKTVQVYGVQFARYVKRFRFKDFLSTGTDLLYQKTNDDNYVGHLTFVHRAHPDLLGTFFDGEYTDWDAPTPTGTLFGFPEPDPGP